MNNEEEGTVKEEVELGEDGKPVVLSQILGLMRIDTSKLIYQQRIDDFAQRSYHKHHYFFEPTLCTSPEFVH